MLGRYEPLAGMDQVRVITDDLAIRDKPAGPLRGYVGGTCVWA
jgi:hypothetical protein